MNKKFSVMKRCVMVTIVVSILLLLLSAPVIATITNEGVKQLTTNPSDQTCISWSPDGTKMAYLSRDQYSRDHFGFWVMNADGTKKIQIDTSHSWNDDGFFIGLDYDWSPDSKAIVYTHYEVEESGREISSIWMINIETGEKIKLASRAMHPSWSPDGRKITYVGYLSYYYLQTDLWIMNSDGHGKRKIASNADFNAYPAWSPDGGKIAYISWHEERVRENTAQRTIHHVDIWVMCANGTNNTKLVSNATLPKWSPDGTKIAYQSGWFAGDSIWIVKPDGTGKKCLATNSDSIDFPLAKWSPDGTKIAYSAEGIWVVNVDGSGGHLITPYSKYYSWSPDGKRLVYESEQKKQHPHHGDIYVISVDGGRERKLIENGVVPLWSPDGTKIAYTSGRAGDSPYNVDIWVMTIVEKELGLIPDIGVKISGFEAMLAITGLLAVAYLVRRRK